MTSGAQQGSATRVTPVDDPAQNDVFALGRMAGNMANPGFDALFAQAQDAASLLKALAHEGRLMILCSLVEGEKSVTELETLLNARQATVSQQLARLRLEGIVSARRDGKAIYYTLRDPKARQMITLLYAMFCQPDQGQ